MFTRIKKKIRKFIRMHKHIHNFYGPNEWQWGISMRLKKRKYFLNWNIPHFMIWFLVMPSREEAVGGWSRINYKGFIFMLPLSSRYEPHGWQDCQPDDGEKLNMAVVSS